MLGRKKPSQFTTRFSSANGHGNVNTQHWRDRDRSEQRKPGLSGGTVAGKRVGRTKPENQEGTVCACLGAEIQTKS